MMSLTLNFELLLIHKFFLLLIFYLITIFNFNSIFFFIIIYLIFLCSNFQFKGCYLSKDSKSNDNIFVDFNEFIIRWCWILFSMEYFVLLITIDGKIVRLGKLRYKENENILSFFLFVNNHRHWYTIESLE